MTAELTPKKSGPPAGVKPKSAARKLYEASLVRDSGEQTIPVQLVIGDTMIVYNTDMTVAMIYAILDPDVPDTFIRLRNLTVSSGTPPAMGVHKFLHTSHIREVILQQDLPERGA